MGVDVGEESSPEPFDCPRCGGKIQQSVDYCPHCTLKLDDEPPTWYQMFRRITDEDDPLRMKYDELAGTAPPLVNLPKSEFDHAYEMFGLAVLLYDAESSGQDLDDYDWTDEVDVSDLSEDDVDHISENWVSPSEPLTQNYLNNETEYQLTDSVTGLSPGELQNLVDEQQLADDD